MLHITVIANEKGGRGEEERKKNIHIREGEDTQRQGAWWVGGWGRAASEGKKKKTNSKNHLQERRRLETAGSPLVSARSLAPFLLGSAVYMTLFPFQQTGPRLGKQGGGRIKKSQGRLPKSVD